MASFAQSGSAIYGPCPATSRGAGSCLDVNTAGTKLVYTVGSVVVVRDVANPGICEVYAEHKANTSVARFSPNGNYIASGDAHGKVRMWAYDHPERLLKHETPAFSGKIEDLCWGPEGKRIIAVGANGKAKAFQADTGSAQGAITGHTKTILSVSFKPTRPYRVVTASEDFKVCFFAGPPFKFQRSHKKHTNFVSCVRFAPNGEHFVSVSNDKKIILYEGKDGEFVRELPGAAEHKGSIYNCTWSADSTKLLTCSADKTVKLWDVEAGTVVQTFNVSERPSVGDMQVACLYAGDQVMSLSLSGDINYFDPASGTVPTRVVQGHSSAVLSLASDSSRLYSGAVDGDVCAWDCATGVGNRLGGVPHKSRAVGLGVSGPNLYSVGWDDVMRSAEVASGASEYSGASAPMGGQPRGISAAPAGGLTAVVTQNGVVLSRDGKVVCSESTPWEPTCVAIKADGSEVAVGAPDNMVYTFAVSGDSMSATGKTLDMHASKVTAVAYSPDGQYIAIGDSTKLITLHDAASGDPKIWTNWVFHTGSITTLAWSPDSKFLASGSVDSHIFIWNPAVKKAKTQLAFAHTGGVSSLVWLDEATLYSGGDDHCVRKWAPTLPVA